MIIIGPYSYHARDSHLPDLPVVPGELAFQDSPGSRVEVSALLDTGNDVTIVSPVKVRELERRMNSLLPVLGQVEYAQPGRREPAYPLGFVFDGDHHDHLYFAIDYPFISPADWVFDVADLWLGQEVLSQLEVCFDGVNRMVTLRDQARY